MAWIELHQSLIKHPKTTKAAEIIGMDRYKFIGHLISFWLWALEYADVDGNLPGNVTITMMALAAGLGEVNSSLSNSLGEVKTRRSPKQENSFVQALLNCGDENQAGFLEINDGHYQIHDWRDFAGRLLEKRIANKERMYHARAMHKENTNTARAGATVPTQPTQPTNISKDILLPVLLPEWVNKEVWEAFLEMRKKKKKVPTDYAVKLIFKDLETFKVAGDNPNEVLNKSIVNGWTDVFPLKKDANNSYNNPKNIEKQSIPVKGVIIES
jgi:hypothetical protein